MVQPCRNLHLEKFSTTTIIIFTTIITITGSNTMAESEPEDELGIDDDDMAVTCYITS
jgi:hypothetical protein